MSKKAYRISPEVKQDILRRIKDEGVSVAQAAKDHGVNESTIYNWLGASTKGTPSWADLAKLQKQNKELFEVIGELTVKLSTTQKKS
jgi:transposase-like protein